jgi:hypothetical protein
MFIFYKRGSKNYFNKLIFPDILSGTESEDLVTVNFKLLMILYIHGNDSISECIFTSWLFIY